MITTLSKPERLAVEAALDDWLHYADGELAEFDAPEPCDIGGEEDLCSRNCHNVGCIRRKIHSARAALKILRP